MKWYKDKKNYIIILGNLIPLFGFITLNWSATDTFLFYMFELIIYETIIIPKIVLFAFTKNKLKGRDKSTPKGPNSIAGKIFASIGYLIFNLLMFGIVLMVFAMFALSPDYSFTADINYLETIITSFLQINYLIIIFIAAEYIYNFFSDHIYRKEYLTLQFNFQYHEAWGLYLIIYMLAISLPIMLYVMILPPESNHIDFENTKEFNLILLLGIIVFKTISELLIKRIKAKIIKKSKEV